MSILKGTEKKLKKDRERERERESERVRANVCYCDRENIIDYMWYECNNADKINLHKEN